MSVLLDTTVVVDLLRERAPALQFIAGVNEWVACSEISRIEVLQGMRSEERHATRRVLATFDWLPVDRSVAERAGQFARHYRRGFPGVGLADFIIAATVGVHGLTLATGNVRHFPMFPDLEAAY